MTEFGGERRYLVNEDIHEQAEQALPRVTSLWQSAEAGAAAALLLAVGGGGAGGAAGAAGAARCSAQECDLPGPRKGVWGSTAVREAFHDAACSSEDATACPASGTASSVPRSPCNVARAQLHSGTKNINSLSVKEASPEQHWSCWGAGKDHRANIPLIISPTTHMIQHAMYRHVEFVGGRRV